MIDDMYKVMNRINEIKKRFGLIKQSHNQNRNVMHNRVSLFEKMKNDAIHENTRTNSELKVNPLNTQVQNIEKIADFYADKNKISPSLLKSLIKVESGYNPNAVSAKGAKGLMQLMPSVLKDFDVKNPFSPDENIKAGSSLLKKLLEDYNWDYKKALAAYNAGKGAVNRAGGIPDYKETKDFVSKVINNYMRNK